MNNSKKNKYFTQLTSTQMLILPKNMPDIDQVISIIVEPNIISYKVINGMKGKSTEGEFLTGKELIVELELKKKVLYISNSVNKGLYLLETKSFDISYMIVPPFFEGTMIESLIKHNRFKLNVNLDTSTFKKIDSRRIFITGYFCIEGIFKPTYELCFSQLEKISESNIFICYNNGSNIKKITSEKVNLAPKWSPLGQNIAFLRNDGNGFMLCLYNTSLDNTLLITDTKDFKSITSFCWEPNGRYLIFSAIKNQSTEIFSVNINTHSYNQLTYSDNYVKNSRPRCSYDGKKIAYLKKYKNFKDLCIMEMSAKDNTQITRNANIKDFDWNKNNTKIAYINIDDAKKNHIEIIDINSYEKQIIELEQNVHSIKKLLYLNSTNQLSFISTHGKTQDIYIYNLDNNSFTNITNNEPNVLISDYTWNIDNNKLYYSANNLGYYNIYCVEDAKKYSLTNLFNSEIKVHYRPRII